MVPWYCFFIVCAYFYILVYYLLISSVSRTSAAIGLKFYNAQNTLSMYYCNVSEEVFYRATQRKYTITFCNKLSHQLYVTYKPFVAGFYQGSEPYLAQILVFEDFLFSQIIHHL